MSFASSPIRVGFSINYDVQTWLGGLNYLRNLFTVIREFLPDQLFPILITGRNISPLLGELGWGEWHRTPLLDAGHPLWWARQAVFKLSRRDFLMEMFLRSCQINVLSHSRHLGPGSKIPVIGWIPDFQYEYLPEYFSSADLAFKRAYHLSLCQHARVVIVSSQAAKHDFERFFPNWREKARVLHFVAVSMGCPNPTPLQELERKYGFEGPFFHLPNQFWAHKNHHVVIEALSQLASHGKRVLILATGKTEDSRNPHFFPELLETARKAGVAELFRVLRTIPFADLVGLMIASRAILNPSKFEGWSTSVEEAKFLGKLVILSDIPVHREQNPPGGLFFPPDNANILAEHLSRVLDSPTGKRLLTFDFLQENRPRAQGFARDFENIVHEVLSS